MNFLIKLLTPVLLKLGESLLSRLFIFLKGAYDLWVLNKKLDVDDKKIDNAFKNKDRRKAAIDLNATFNEGAT